MIDLKSLEEELRKHSEVKSVKPMAMWGKDGLEIVIRSTITEWSSSMDLEEWEYAFQKNKDLLLADTLLRSSAIECENKYFVWENGCSVIPHEPSAAFSNPFADLGSFGYHLRRSIGNNNIAGTAWLLIGHTQYLNVPLDYCLTVRFIDWAREEKYDEIQRLGLG